jgi:GAF domain-containing protein
VQSSRVGTFDPDAVSVLQTMADQVSVALDNARLFAESQQALEATRRAYSQLSSQAWTDLLRGRTDWGYAFASGGYTGAGVSPGRGVLPVEGSWPPEMIEALRTGQAIVRQPAGDQPLQQSVSAGPTVPMEEPALALPLMVRDDVIGAVGFYRDSGDGAWAAEEMELLGRLVNQLGMALESAQLFQETQRRAAREQAIRQITERMRQAVDVEAILQNTVVELAKALGVPRAYVRLGTEAEILDGKDQQGV